jgi:hypothetical protein
MSAPKDGGPAFPTEWILIGMPDESRLGMSLRDWFAGQALAGLVAQPTMGRVIDTASIAYRVADAMLAAREVKP